MTPGPALDPAIAAWLRQLARDRARTPAVTVEDERRIAREVSARTRAPEYACAESRTSVGDIPAVVCRPARAPTATIVYFHGGGWIAGGLDTHVQHCRRLSAQAGAVVVAVDYRLAPEHPHPAAFHDAVAATQCVADDIGRYGGRLSRLVVAGDSAGANLAAAVALHRRDTRRPLGAQLLISPATDLAGGYDDPTVNRAYPSRRQFAEGYGLTTTAMARNVHAYAPGADTTDRRLSPLRATTFRGLAPAVVHTAGFDPLRDEGDRYARALSADGIRVIHRTWPTLNHSYFGLGRVCMAAERAATQASTDLLHILRNAST